MKGEGSLLSMCIAESCGEGMVIVRGNIGNGMGGCGDGGGICILR